LADALERMLTDKQLYDSCCTNALALVKERYDDMALAKKLTELYNELMNNK